MFELREIEETLGLIEERRRVGCYPVRVQQDEDAQDLVIGKSG